MSKFKSGKGSNKNDVLNNCQRFFELTIGKKSPNISNHVLGIKCWTKFPCAV